MKSWLFVLNPGAGRGRAGKAWEVLQPLLDAEGFAFDLVVSLQRGDVAQALARAAGEGRSRVVLIGGDGTMHEAVNGLMATGLPAESLPVLSLLPAGSGNDWAKWWRLPHDPRRWWAGARDWNEWSHPAGRIELTREDRPHRAWFLNVAGMAYDGWVVRRIEEAPQRKRNAFIYLYSVLRWLGRYRPKAGELQANGQCWAGRFWTVNAGICPYSGGGMRLVPHARPDGQMLALTVAGKIPLWRILINLWRFYHGSIGRVPGVETLFADALRMAPAAGESIDVEADGEWLGQAPVEIRILPDAFRVAAPGRPSVPVGDKSLSSQA